MCVIVFKKIDRVSGSSQSGYNKIFVSNFCPRFLTRLQSFSRYDFNTGGEDRLGTHDAPVRCVEYSHATGEIHPLGKLVDCSLEVNLSMHSSNLSLSVPYLCWCLVESVNTSLHE